MMSGGYSKELFVNKVIEELECGICLFVMREPVLTPCGHAFCLSCFVVSLSSQQEDLSTL